MAVTVEQAPFVVLDSWDRIVGVGPDVESQFGPLAGSVVWDCFPGSEPLFKPYYDHARSSGESVEFVQFYDGFVARIRATPCEGEQLELRWEQLARVDATTLERLAESLSASLELLDDEVNRNELRRSLRVIAGGG